ncbi:hypothetical protein DFP72DRAFT_420594 [Ephemerocybe angulata]|uniref:Secreted protein n=1 Tax=Ephemerocybe angulata TaxID=980116 RepID=A0A8H6IG37_9AGAR|nr:hypothetical protein DFP72DRAFT_420594 [Tulosesus angulatus]
MAMRWVVLPFFLLLPLRSLLHQLCDTASHHTPLLESTGTAQASQTNCIIRYTPAFTTYYLLHCLLIIPFADSSPTPFLHMLFSWWL